MRSIFLILIFIIFLSACTPGTQTIEPWQLGDLRLLELPDISDPTSDLIAIYTRQIDNDFQIRLDFLDLQPDFQNDIYILLDTTSTNIKSGFPISLPAISSFISNHKWDLLLSLPHHGYPQTFLAGNIHPIPVLSPRVQFDPLMDMVLISLNRNIVPSLENLAIQIFITTPDDKTIIDLSPPISKPSLKSIQTAPLILAFTDIFPVFTPAQALRRWDGAHTGPTGERHGLVHILTNAQIYNIPIFLLDLKNPSSLSALSFMEALPQIQLLLDQDLLLIPDLIISDPGEHNLQTNQKVASSFGFPGSNFIYSIDGRIQTGYDFQFTDLPDRSHLIEQAGKTLIPLPNLEHKNAPIQASNEGLTLEVRRQLLTTALSSDPTDLVILGGSLPFSTWGDSDMSMASMAYIAAHPWIQPLNSNQLQFFIGKQEEMGYEPNLISPSPFPIFNSHGNFIGLDSNKLHSNLIEILQISPKNTISDLAWQMFFSLTSLPSDTIENQLNFQYLNQVVSIIEASRWMEYPVSISDCSRDIDWDLINECILSNSQFFAIIELDGGRMSFLFERDGDRAHQLIGPLSQFFVGLSDSSLWNIDQGPAGDPAEIPGAFSDSGNPFMDYGVKELSNDMLILDRADDQVEKVFRLGENGLTVEINSVSAVSMDIPLAVDPQIRFQPGWKNLYYSQNSSDSFKWGVLGITSLQIKSTSPFSVQNFLESTSLLAKPENPDLDYPPGHFLPFPFTLIKFSGKEPFSVDILVKH